MAARLKLRLAGGELVYRILDTPVARKWTAHLRRCDLRRPRVDWNLKRDAASFERKSTELEAVVAALRAEGYRDLPKAGMDQAALNALHEVFNRYVFDGAKEGGRRHELVHRLNLLIHWFENAERGYHEYFVLSFNENTPPPEPLAAEDYESLSIERSFGDLVLGYGRVGKTLPHCFYDDDAGPVKRREIVSASMITPQCVGYVSRRVYPPEHSATHLRRFEAWCLANGTQDYGYDLRAPEHRPGAIPVARLEQPADESLLKDGAAITAAILET